MKFLITSILIMLLITSMFGFFYQSHSHNNGMQNYQINSPWTMNNTSLHHNYNMMNNNFKMNRGMNQNSMRYRYYKI